MSNRLIQFTTRGLDATLATAQSLFTTIPGRTFTITQVTISTTGGTGYVSNPSDGSIGFNTPTPTNLGLVTIVGFITNGQAASRNTDQTAQEVVVPGGSEVKLIVGTPGVGTTQPFQVDVIGFYI
jgi:hypothetical protein